MVDHQDAKVVLEQAWGDISKSGIVPRQELQKLINKVMEAEGAKGFRYVLVTGILARCVNPAVHPRALQARSSLRGAYDARSLCHKIVVTFEKTKGNLFGLSNEPFVSKALRHPEHDKNNPQLRNKRAAADLHEALEMIRTAPEDEVYSALVYVLRLGKTRADAERAAVVAGGRTLQLCLDFVANFLRQADGGSRLVAVWGALLALSNEEAEIRVYNPNQSDEFSGTLGDVEVIVNEAVVSASECKHRPLTLDDVEHGLRKNRIGAEYVFVVAAGLQKGQEDAIAERISLASKHGDVSLIDAHREFIPMLKMIGPHRRQKFGQCVVELLRNMREFDSAEAAAAIWNELESE